MLDEVVGQDDAVHLFRRVLEGKLDSPLLLVGEDGVGKRFSVEQFTREAFCTGTKQSDCDCVHCYQLGEGVHPDFVTVSTPEDKDIGVGFIRGLIQDAETAPTLTRRKVFFVDGCDRLTVVAANAYLKTLEEPPDTVRLFLSARSTSRVLPTIRSRCAVVNYRRLPADFIASKLHQIEANPEKALVYARLADGSLGRAVDFKANQRLMLRDKMLHLISAATSGDLTQVFGLIDELGTDLPLGVSFLTMLVHDMLLLPHNSSGIVNLDVASSLEKARSGFKPGALTLFWNRLKAVLDRRERARVNLSFQLKALFAGMLV